MDNVITIQKPKGRGRFCERHVWDQIHRDRFERWLEGDTIESIAGVHHVTQRAIHLSIARVMVRLHREHRLLALQYRHDSKYGWKIQDAALIEYRALMDPSWLFAQIQRMMRGARAGRTRKNGNPFSPD